MTFPSISLYYPPKDKGSDKNRATQRSNPVPKTKQRQKPFPSRIKRKRRFRSPSRIPGMAVGEEVETSEGPKKKVCFNIGGKWFFKMVDPDWRPQGRPPKYEA